VVLQVDSSPAEARGVAAEVSASLCAECSAIDAQMTEQHGSDGSASRCTRRSASATARRRALRQRTVEGAVGR
jgi:hypothetical protein